MKQPVFLLTLFLATALSATDVDRLLGEYQQIKTVTCQIRRTVSGGAGTIQFISRVYWQNDDRLHVDNLTPLPRRIIADGSTFFSYAKGDPKGFSRPVAALSEAMTFSLRKIPGTPMDHLLRLKGLSEQELESKDGMIQRGYDTGSQYVVLSFDNQNRLVQVEFFKSSECKEKTGTYNYSRFTEVVSGVWIPFIHEAILTMTDGEFKEVVRVDRFTANQPIAESLFIPSNFFYKDIDFVDEFSEIYFQSEEKQ